MSRPLRLLLVVLVAGCAHHARQQPTEGEVVKSISFSGNGGGLRGTGDYQVRSAMEQGANPTFTWVAPRRRQVFLNREELELDAWRVETWYAHHGFFDARFVGWDLVTVRPGSDRRPPAIRISGQVREGLPATVRKIVWEHMDPVGAPILALMENQAELQVGARFNLDDAQATAEQARDTLHERTFARATVSMEIEAFPEEHAVDVKYTGDLGRPCVFGEVTITGDLGVPEAMVRDEVLVEPGKPYRESALAATRRRLFGLGIFSVVNVVPDLASTDDNVIPVRIELSPTRYRQLRLGGGLAVESGKQDLHVITDFRHANLFGRLVGLTVSNRVGYTALATIGEVTEEGLEAGLEQVTATAGPTLLSQVVVTIPRFPARRWSLENQASFELGVEEGYRYAAPEFSPSLLGRVTEHFTLGFSWHLRYFDYIDPTLTEADTRDTRLGLDFTDPYLLSYLSQQVIFDNRDDKLFTRVGAYGLYEVSEAGGPVGGQFNFLRLTMDQRAYRPIGLLGWRPRGASVAGRVGGGWIIPYGSEDRAKVPYAERIYIGGSSTVRGWKQDHLGPYICDPAAGPDCVSHTGRAQPSADILPIGGLLALYGGAEVRAYFRNTYGVAAFTDLGMAWPDLASAWPLHLQPTVGLGGRYKSLIGPVRLDVGVRLGNEPMFAMEPRFNIHFALAESY